MSGPDPGHGAGPEPGPGRRDAPETVRDLWRADHLARLLRSEPGLWPLVAVVAIVAVTLGTTLILSAWRQRSAVAAAALAILLLGSALAVESSLRRRRPGAALWIALGFWSASALAAFALHRFAGV